jgi:hypothetical protein
MSVTNDQINQWIAANPNATAADKQAAMQQYGVSQDQVNQATGIIASAQQPTAPASGGLSVGGSTYTPQQIKDFYANGGNDVQFAQQHGITDPTQIHDLAVHARGIAGTSSPTGDASLQSYYNQYKTANPNGAYANDYQGWVNDQNPNTRDAMVAGTYTGNGATQSPTDYKNAFDAGQGGNGWTGSGWGNPTTGYANGATGPVGSLTNPSQEDAGPLRATVTPGTGSPAGITNQQIQDWVVANPNANAQDYYAAMQKYGITVDQLSQATGRSVADLNAAGVNGGLNNSQLQGVGSTATTNPGTATIGTTGMNSPIAANYNAAQTGDPTKWNVTSDQTVQGQMANMLDPNSPYYQAWKTAGAQEAAARGFTGNSSIRDSAIQDSLIRNATPIATSDATTYGKAAGYNADIKNQVALSNTTAQNTANQTNVAADNARYLGNLSASSQTLISAAHDANSTLIQSNQAAASAFSNLQNAIAQIDQNNTMDTAAKTAAIQTQQQAFNTTIAGLRAAQPGTPDVSSLLTFGGTPATGTTSTPAAQTGIINSAQSPLGVTVGQQ